jgi:hypothetical protein
VLLSLRQRWNTTQGKRIYISWQWVDEEAYLLLLLVFSEGAMA